MSESDDKYLTAKEVAAKLQVSANTVYRWFAEGKLKGIKTGQNNSCIRIEQTSFSNFLKEAAERADGI